MKKVIFVFFLTLFARANAQDTLITTSGEIIPVMVKTISATAVEYKKVDNPDGPTYVRSKSEVIAVRYKNGTVDTFSSNKATASTDDYIPGGSTPSKKSGLTMNDVLNTPHITFYGLDFSGCSLIEAKREKESDKIKSVFFPEWNALFVKQIPAKTMARWLKKTDVTYITDMIGPINDAAEIENVVTAFPNDVDMKSSIKRTVANIGAKDISPRGIGFVINVEYFYKARTETAVYFTFFDLETDAVISSERVVVKEIGSGGLTKYWGDAIAAAMKEYVDRRYRRY